jgi:hypothetical protein
MMTQPSEMIAPAVGRSGDGRPVTLVELLHTTRELDETLVPVQPRPEFRDTLYRDLILSAQRQATQRALSGVLDLSSPGSDAFGDWRPERSSRRLVWGAAAVGLSSAASVIGVMAAYYWRRRGRKIA